MYLVLLLQLRLGQHIELLHLLLGKYPGLAQLGRDQNALRRLLFERLHNEAMLAARNGRAVAVRRRLFVALALLHPRLSYVSAATLLLLRLLPAAAAGCAPLFKQMTANKRVQDEYDAHDASDREEAYREVVVNEKRRLLVNGTRRHSWFIPAAAVPALLYF